MERLSTRHKRFQEIFYGEGSGAKNMLPSDMWGSYEIVRTYCEMCSKPIAIRPAIYPHWIRRKDGTIAHLCSACDYTPCAPWRGNRVER